MWVLASISATHALFQGSCCSPMLKCALHIRNCVLQYLPSKGEVHSVDYARHQIAFAHKCEASCLSINVTIAQLVEVSFTDITTERHQYSLPPSRAYLKKLSQHPTVVRDTRLFNLNTMPVMSLYTHYCIAHFGHSCCGLSSWPAAIITHMQDIPFSHLPKLRLRQCTTDPTTCYLILQEQLLHCHDAFSHAFGQF